MSIRTTTKSFAVLYCKSEPEVPLPCVINKVLLRISNMRGSRPICHHLACLRAAGNIRRWKPKWTRRGGYQISFYAATSRLSSSNLLMCMLTHDQHMRLRLSRGSMQGSHGRQPWSYDAHNGVFRLTLDSKLGWDSKLLSCRVFAYQLSPNITVKNVHLSLILLRIKRQQSTLLLQYMLVLEVLPCCDLSRGQKRGNART